MTRELHEIEDQLRAFESRLWDMRGELADLSDGFARATGVMLAELRLGTAGRPAGHCASPGGQKPRPS